MKQLNLHGLVKPNGVFNHQSPKILNNYIDQETEKELVKIIDALPWITNLKRRVQHYGWRYDYKARRIDYGMKLGTLPDWVEILAKRLFYENWMPYVPDQVIINEYLPGQGIASHVDCCSCFEGTIASLSLLSTCIMDFEHTQSQQKISVTLEPQSLIILNDEFRYDWKHAIPARKSDVIDGHKLTRQRRLSLTFRKVIIHPI